MAGEGGGGREAGGKRRLKRERGRYVCLLWSLMNSCLEHGRGMIA